MGAPFDLTAELPLEATQSERGFPWRARKHWSMAPERRQVGGQQLRSSVVWRAGRKS